MADAIAHIALGCLIGMGLIIYANTPKPPRHITDDGEDLGDCRLSDLLVPPHKDRF